LVVTNHNPLIPIFNNGQLDEIENLRLQRLKYHVFTAKWIKGKRNNAPHALSVSDPQWNGTFAEFDHQHQSELSITEIRLLHCDEHDSARLYKLSEEATKDPDYRQLHHIINHGFLDHRSQLVEACRCFWNVREHLTIVDG